ncbi:ScbA/BarX family gamma-butyrolactone biosynthesis protein [Streptomyces fructofermentans]|uniref:ScbA/BarX family gamma-butyrolactone biosynthesis protein n=1 Tax=Streptomyces fructofermentans TaxID=152141 RepID=UPI0037A3E3BB
MSASPTRTPRTTPTARHPQSTTRAPHRTTPPHHPTPLTRTVPKEYVHRAAIAEVLLTGWERRSTDRYTVTGQWPRRHPFYTPLDGHHDPLLVAETVRQAGLLLAHTEYHVPLTHHFLMWDLTINTNPTHLHQGPTPPTITIDATCTDIKHRATHLAGFRLNTTLHRDGHPAATTTASFTCVSPAVHQRLRAPHTHPHQPPLTPPPPTHPHHVGRTHPDDVVLSPTPTPHHWQLRTNTHHPTLFDHPLDHTPGMLLIEAARQATTAHHNHHPPTHPDPHHITHLTATFHRYAELHLPTHIHTTHTPHPNHTHTTHTTGTQNNTTIYTTTITTTPHPTA